VRTPLSSPRGGFFIAAFILFALLSRFASAAMPLGPEPGEAGGPLAKEPIVEICEAIQGQKTYFLQGSKWRAIWDMLRVKLAPRRLAKPYVQVLPTEPSRLLPLPDGRFGKGLPAVGRNLIFSLEPPAALSNSPEYARDLERYRAVNATVMNMRAQLTFLVTAPDATACVARAKSSGFDLATFNKLAAEFAEVEWVNRVHEGQVARASISNKLHRLHMKWELYSASDLGMVLDALRSNEVRNVMIVAHATSDGQIIDGALNEYPARFFSDISPTVESISIYSCHGTNVREVYKLDQALAKGPTFHARREIFTPQSTTIAGQKDVVPMVSVVGFLRRVDRWLSVSPFDSAAPAASRSQNYCGVDLEGLDVRKGGYLLLLNNQVVGAVTASMRAPGPGPFKVTFPCALLNREGQLKHIFVTRNTAFDGKSEIVSPESIRGRISNEQGKQVELPTGTHYRKPGTGAYQSSKWEIPAF
jgi:hypothetical protein